jgi:hypothetical protein
MTITETEAFILDCIKQNISVANMVRKRGCDDSCITKAITKLIRKGIIVRVSTGKYEILNDNVTVRTKREPVPKTAQGRKDKPDNLVKLMVVPLTEEQKLYADGHKKQMTRSQLAKRLGVPKMQLNFYLGGNDAS